MFTAKQYRAKAAEYTELLKAASLPAETREFRRLEQSYLTLAENEEWMADNREKIHSPGADNNWYGDAILAQQGKHALGWHRADVATQSTAIPAKIQQLFDDAGLGGLLQTATLRRQIARFLHKHKVDDFTDLSMTSFGRVQPATVPLLRSSTNAMSARRAVGCGRMSRLERSCTLSTAQASLPMTPTLPTKCPRTSSLSSSATRSDANHPIGSTT